MLDAGKTAAAVQIAVDLANTLKPVKGEDALETVEQLRDFLDSRLLAEGRGPVTRADLDEVRALRESVRAVLERAGTDAAGAAALINDGLRGSDVSPVLRHDGEHWWIEAASGSDRRSAHLAAITLGALASVIATLGPARLGVCAGPHCRGTFVDLSRNGSKQFCTRACAHRASVSAYRSRRISN
ncbi:CGNR zinc finger domain-containing protein [Amycolatopsis sp. lyj-23]|uniref:CGNR zinc finger domain-containing protein n=1 Tax=Amycolatopsis sp. lyj-23 TaxID=2789283 RepID=UPI00397B6799